MTVTGDLDKLSSLYKLLDFAMTHYQKLETQEDAKIWRDGIDWLIDTQQAIKDLEFEQSINPLPFK